MFLWTRDIDIDARASSRSRGQLQSPARRERRNGLMNESKSGTAVNVNAKENEQRAQRRGRVVAERSAKRKQRESAHAAMADVAPNSLRRACMPDARSVQRITAAYGAQTHRMHAERDPSVHKL